MSSSNSASANSPSSLFASKAASALTSKMLASAGGTTALPMPSSVSSGSCFTLDEAAVADDEAAEAAAADADAPSQLEPLAAAAAGAAVASRAAALALRRAFLARLNS